MRFWNFSKSLSCVMFFGKGSSVLIPGFDSFLLRDANSSVSRLKWGRVTVLPMNLCGSWRTPPVSYPSQREIADGYGGGILQWVRYKRQKLWNRIIALVKEPTVPKERSMSRLFSKDPTVASLCGQTFHILVATFHPQISLRWMKPSQPCPLGSFWFSIWRP